MAFIKRSTTRLETVKVGSHLIICMKCDRPFVVKGSAPDAICPTCDARAQSSRNSDDPDE